MFCKYGESIEILFQGFSRTNLSKSTDEKSFSQGIMLTRSGDC